jgi:hypothetical protein
MSVIIHSTRKNWALLAAESRAERGPTASFLPAIFAFLRRAAVKCAQLLLQVSDNYAEARLHQAMIEEELFRNRYNHSSKNDDDLPIAGPAPAAQTMPSVSPRAALKRAAGAVIAMAKRVYLAVAVLLLIATALAAAIAFRLAIWLPFHWQYWH